MAFWLSDRTVILSGAKNLSVGIFAFPGYNPPTPFH